MHDLLKIRHEVVGLENVPTMMMAESSLSWKGLACFYGNSEAFCRG